jgi:CRP/FNR family transcriptional regulator
MNTFDAIFSVMAASAQFADLDPMVLRTIAACCRSETFLADQMVFMEGDPCRSLYILESGRVNFFRTNAEGREQILKVFERPGDMFCIASAFNTKIHIVSGRAVTETRLHLLDMDAMNSLAREHPSVGLKIVSMERPNAWSLCPRPRSTKTSEQGMACFFNQSHYPANSSTFFGLFC